MNDLKSLVPRDKYDIEAVATLEKAGYPAIAPILDEVVGWLADGNWPVARPLGRFLATIGTPIVDPILKVLRAPDSTAKYHCIVTLVIILPLEVLKLLEGDLRVLAQGPSAVDRREEVNEVARDALMRLTR